MSVSPPEDLLPAVEEGAAPVADPDAPGPAARPPDGPGAAPPSDGPGPATPGEAGKTGVAPAAAGGEPDADARAAAAALLEAARAEAEALRREAREQGEREGWEAGYAAGRVAAWEKVRQEAEETLHAALAILEDARRERLVILRQAQEDVVGMALELAARVLDREVSVSSEVVKEQAAALLRRLEQGERATLHVNPEDVAVMERWGPELARACGVSLEVVADPSVGKGGVMVETGHGYLDGRLDRQLRRLGEALLAWTRALPGPGDAGAEAGDAGTVPAGEGGGGDGQGGERPSLG